MVESPRMRRLRSDFQVLERLKQESSIFDFEAYGQPPDHYVLYFRGTSVYRHEQEEEVLPRRVHEVVLRLGANYPRSAPAISWRTPIFHPNVAASGVVCLGAYGQHWAPSVALDELCRMLWDMLRYANYDVDSPYNRSAAQWARASDPANFPLDVRPLRDITAGLAKKTPPQKAKAALQDVQPPAKLPAKPQFDRQPVKRDVEFLEATEVVVAEVVPTPVRATNEQEILFIS